MQSLHFHLNPGHRNIVRCPCPLVFLGCFSDTSKNLKSPAICKLEFLNYDLSPVVLLEKMDNLVLRFCIRFF